MRLFPGPLFQMEPFTISTSLLLVLLWLKMIKSNGDTSLCNSDARQIDWPFTEGERSSKVEISSLANPLRRGTRH